jgi:PAS domain S-box-containing protein
VQSFSFFGAIVGSVVGVAVACLLLAGFMHDPALPIRDRIKGACSNGKRAVTASLLKLESHPRVVALRAASDSITLQDLEGRTLAWNPGAVKLYGWTEAEALSMNVQARIPEALRKEELSHLLELSRAEVLAPYRTQRLTRAGGCIEIWLTATALRNEAGIVYAIATTERATGPLP